MKLAKKMLASVIALAMIAALSLTAFAAPAVVITADKTAVTIGDEVTVTVNGSDIKGLKSGDLVFTYDDTVLQYVSSKVLYPDFDLKTTNGNVSGSFRFSFAYLENATEDNAFVSVTFKAIAAGDAEFALVAIGSKDEAGKEIGSWDGTEVPAAASLKIAVAEPTEAPSEVETEAPTAAPTEAPSETVAPTEAPKGTDQTGATGVAAVAGVMALAAVAFVATRKKDEE